VRENISTVTHGSNYKSIVEISLKRRLRGFPDFILIGKLGLSEQSGQKNSELRTSKYQENGENVTIWNFIICIVHVTLLGQLEE
jgi:hypothetical protein